MEALTLDQVRDNVAELLGYRRVDRTRNVTYPHWLDSRGEPVCYSDPDGPRDGEPGAHPIDKTIDGIAALWPKGWKWVRDGYYWRAGPRTANSAGASVRDYRVEVEDTGSEYSDRLNLLRACLLAGGGG